MKLRWFALLLVMVLALAACGNDAAEDVTDDAGGDTATDEPDAEDPADDEGSADDGAGGGSQEATGDSVTVAVADTDLGEVLVDGDQMTLYLFESDSDGTSTCYEGCAANWPPLLAESATAADGADGSLLGTTERDDGTAQVTYDGWPLYYWAGDQEPGDTSGQGVGDVWWVVAPDGTAVKESASATSSTSGY